MEVLPDMVLSADLQRFGWVSRVVTDVLQILPLGSLAGTRSLGAEPVVVSEAYTQHHPRVLEHLVAGLLAAVVGRVLLLRDHQRL